jgi:hypothetical protein
LFRGWLCWGCTAIATRIGETMIRFCRLFLMFSSHNSWRHLLMCSEFVVCFSVLPATCLLLCTWKRAFHRFGLHWVERRCETEEKIFIVAMLYGGRHRTSQVGFSSPLATLLLPPAQPLSSPSPYLSKEDT